MVKEYIELQKNLIKTIQSSGLSYFDAKDMAMQDQAKTFNEENKKTLIKAIQLTGISYFEAKDLVIKGQIQIKLFDPKNESKILNRFKELGASGHAVVNRDKRSNVYINTLIEINLF